ncbi:MAG: helix-turn-helix transcriptional regulator [Clostridia bacterium]|nr:helix-turn-helix transcriptional regulator [Clostridia bacterium]
MRITIGEKIKELRLKKGCTQEKMAAVLGITGQAVSRWENGTSYPDLEMIPALANFFRISIDQLFGYDADRQKRIGDILAAVEELKKAEKPDDEKIVALLRDACAEFPGDEKLTFELADALYKQGNRDGMTFFIDSDSIYPRFDTEKNRENVYWQESIQLFRHLVSSASDEKLVRCSRQNLVYLYHSTGEHEEAVRIAETFPEMCICRENMLAAATDGREHCRYSQELMLAALDNFRFALVGALFSKRYHPLKMPEAFHSYTKTEIETYKGLISLYEMIFEGENLGREHLKVQDLYFRMIYNYGMLLVNVPTTDKAACLDAIFDCLDKVLDHAERYDKLPEQYRYKTPLLDHVPACGKEVPDTLALSKLADVRVLQWTELKEILMDDPRFAKWCHRVNVAAGV